MFCNSVFKSSAKNSHIHVLVVQLLFVFCRLSVTHSIKQVRNCSRFMTNQPATIANLSGGLMKTHDRTEMSLMSSLLRPQAENTAYTTKRKREKINQQLIISTLQKHSAHLTLHHRILETRKHITACTGRVQ